MTEPKYGTVLLKLSGEALAGSRGSGICPHTLRRLAGELKEICKLGCRVGVVIGGGNFFRGGEWTGGGMAPASAHQMGMLATVMNALGAREMLESIGQPAAVLSAIPVGALAELHSHRRAREHLDAGQVVLFAGGTGNPFFTTDTAAALRAQEIGAEVLLKATKVDGIYSADPVEDQTAEKFESITYDEVLRLGLGVMDATAVAFCKTHSLPLRVFDLGSEGSIKRVVSGEDVGSRVY